MSITVQSDVRTYEDGFEQPRVKTIFVRSHWNNDKIVELMVGSETVKVLASDLQAAIKNATNVNRFG